MRAAYVDTSCIVAIAFKEPGQAKVVERLRSFDVLVSANLLEAELCAALVREGVPGALQQLVSGIRWVIPDRPLGPEIQRVANQGYVKGADLWHLACALFVDPGPSELVFATLDATQGRVARELGFFGL